MGLYLGRGTCWKLGTMVGLAEEGNWYFKEKGWSGR